jgi:nucleoside-diphosphate-sugar epimerase
MAIGNNQTLARTLHQLPRVLLTGASSQIGLFVIPRLLAAGFKVIAVSRKGRPDSYPAFNDVKWLCREDALKLAETCQYMLSTGPMKLAQELLQQGGQFQTAVIFSSSSVISKRESGNPAERQMIQGMISSEAALESIADQGGLKLVILRPTLIYGCGLDSNISRLAGLIRRFGFMPLNAGAPGLRQPVHADDLAVVAVKALLSEKALPRLLTVAGGSTLSYREMVSRIFAALDKPVRLVNLPQGLFTLLARVSAITGNISGVNVEMVKRQCVDLVFDDSEARELLDYNPRPFAPTSEDFSLPESFCISSGGDSKPHHPDGV